MSDLYYEANSPYPLFQVPASILKFSSPNILNTSRESNSQPATAVSMSTTWSRDHGLNPTAASNHGMHWYLRGFSPVPDAQIQWIFQISKISAIPIHLAQKLEQMFLGQRRNRWIYESTAHLCARRPYHHVNWPRWQRGRRVSHGPMTTLWSDVK